MRRGVTLIELVVALTIVGMIAAISALTLRHGFGHNDSEPMQRRAQSEAVRSGRPVRMVDSAGGGIPRVLLFLPDGQVIFPDSADSAGQDSQ